jgi:hypothetical protein
VLAASSAPSFSPSSLLGTGARPWCSGSLRSLSF